MTPVREDLAPTGALERLATTEPIEAWRAWTLTGRRDASRLRLRPVGGRMHPWPPRKPAQASCKLGRMHRAPDAECSCGLHGTHGTDILRRTRNPAVLGTIALWGRVVEHELGYRGEFAYPQRLRLVCLLCFWQWGVRGARPETVCSVGWGSLIPLCGPHLGTALRYGLRPRAFLPAAQVQQRLLSTYVVDQLAV